MDPLLRVMSYLPAFGLADYLVLFAIVLTVLAIILARAPRPTSQAPAGLGAALVAGDSVTVLDPIIQHLRAENWAGVAEACASARVSLAALTESDATGTESERARLGLAMEHLSALETLAMAQSGPGAPPTDAAAWLRLTLDLQEVRAILRERESRQRSARRLRPGPTRRPPRRRASPGRTSSA